MPANDENVNQQAADSGATLNPATAAVEENDGPATRFPIVGIGASSGGLAAFEEFFSAIPRNTSPGMAFVLVQHLAPNHKSILSELITKFTHLPVVETRDGIQVQPNCVYIIPPGHDIAISQGTLQLLTQSTPRGQQLPVDFFFRTLALDQNHYAIGIILSGNGSDGTEGIRSIKKEGGMVMVQTPESTEFDSMQRNAIATGLADYQLLPAEMPASLMDYASRLPGRLPRISTEDAPHAENSLRKILVLLRAQTDHDFSQYKTNTIYRRIERRMLVNQIESIDQYSQYLQKSPAEVQLLFHDLLIGVTRFFRDQDAFQALATLAIPRLLSDAATKSGVIRIWVCGCSTGEEAYSIAILLTEFMESSGRMENVQIFATDIDGRAIATARTGFYPNTISADVSPERLARFFTKQADGSGYRIVKRLREMLIFSEQDVTRDPPFSRLELISCRNLLIYLNSDLQRRLLKLFHFALNPSGLLFLGTSGGLSGAESLFSTLDRTAKIFQRKTDLQNAIVDTKSSFSGTGRTAGIQMPRVTVKRSPNTRPPLREFVENALLQNLNLVAALVNSHGDILYLHGRAGQFLEPSPGETGVNNILKMSREGLRQNLAVNLRSVVEARQKKLIPHLRIKSNGDFTSAKLSIFPVSADSRDKQEATDELVYLIVIEQTAEQSAAPHQSTSQNSDGDAVESGETISIEESDARLTELREALLTNEEYLQSTLKELESSNEDLKSSNEEMQAVNEELQSTNEELETSREEMQSVNEELATVNAELQSRIQDLSRLNNDMNNLLAGSGIATIFVDQKLRILRFTPTAASLINLIPGDIGRPVGHIVSNLVNYSSVASDAQTVLDTLSSVDTRVQSTSGQWFAMRIRPYRTLENVIEGVVISFVEITEMCRIEAALQEANSSLRLAAVIQDSVDAVSVQDMQGKILAWNSGAARMYGWSEDEALLMHLPDRLPEPDRVDAMGTLLKIAQSDEHSVCTAQRLTKDGRVVNVRLTATLLINESGAPYGVAATERLLA